MTLRSRAARVAAVAAAAGILLIGIPSPASAAGPSKTVVAATTQSQCTASTRVPETPAALSSLQSSSAWPLTKGAGVTVAIVDSGVAANPHLDGIVLPGVNLVPDGTDGAGRTDNYAHGTVIAGQIAAQLISGSGVEGLAPDAKILPVRVYAGVEKQLVEAGFGPNTARLAEGIRYAADQGAQIINVSISTSEKNATLADAVAYAQQRGSLVVASAGNRTNNDSPEQDDKDGARYPAGFSGVIGVAAVGSEGVVTTASIHGPHVSLSAPGQAIASSWPLGGDCVVGGRDAGVVEGDVDAAEVGGDAVEEGVHGVLVGDVHLTEDTAHLGGGRRTGGLVEVGDHDAGAFGGEAAGGGEPDAAGSSGDDGDAVAQALGEVDGHGAVVPFEPNLVPLMAGSEPLGEP